MIKELFYDLFGYNNKLFFVINHALSGDVLQGILSNISGLFYYYNFLLYFGIALIYSIVQIKKDKTKFEYYFQSLFRSAIIYCCFIFIFTMLKYSVNMPRPLCSFAPETFHSIIAPDSVRCLSSFPSAHSGFALLMGYFIWYYIKLDLIQKLVIISLIVSTGCARISMAMHFPVDVLYGYLFAILVIIIGDYIYRKLPRPIIELARKFLTFSMIHVKLKL
jgi:membrane-associated phospholipid phosphatase